MGKNRIEAFSDGVIAIIITIMVLEIKVPHGTTLEALTPLIPVFLSYVLSFVYVGIYWVNHHHFFHSIQSVNGKILWANLHQLFWLSLVPFGTGWMGETHFATIPTAFYGLLLLFCGIAYNILQTIAVNDKKNQRLAQEIGRDYKGKISLVLYAVAIGLAFINPWLACLIYALVAMMWFIPDKRMERAAQLPPE